MEKINISNLFSMIVCGSIGVWSLITFGVTWSLVVYIACVAVNIPFLIKNN